MLSLVEEWWDSVTSEERETLAPALMAMVEVAEAEAWPKRDVAALLLGDLWALEANAPNGEGSTWVDLLADLVASLASLASH
jgi:hypothetical protein